MARSTYLTPLFLTAVFATLLALPPSAGADEPPPGSVRLDGTVDLLANGDGAARLVVDFHPGQYGTVKGANPNPHQFLRELGSRRSNYEVSEDASAQYDDAKSAILMRLTEHGAVRNLGHGEWEMEITPEAEFVNHAPDAEGRTTFYFYQTGSLGGSIDYRGQIRYRVPAGAESARWDAPARRIRYRLETPPCGGGAARLGVRFQARDRIMSALYKVYGLGTDFTALWVAKSVIRNDGECYLRDLRVRYRLDGYSDWSFWERYPELVPGQTVVVPYYPVLNASIATLTSNTPANLQVEWSYVDAQGKTHEGSEGRRLVILGRHEFVFSNLTTGDSFGTWHESHNNAPFIAAWAARDDLVVRQFAAMGNKIAAGAGATENLEAGLKVLGGIYELLLRNDFTYQHPPGLVDKSTSYDPQFVQNVKFPRDVIRDRSGTCIDLAILYASLANALGIDAYLALIPGHCFPVFNLSGYRVGVEATGVRGGVRFGSLTFQQCLAIGKKTLEDSERDGRIYLINLNEMWTRGVSTPEMPELPADALERWGLSVEGVAGAQQVPQPAPRGGPQGGAQEARFDGSWGGQVTERMDDGRTITYPVAVQIERQRDGTYSIAGAAEAEIPGESGMVRVRVMQQFAGTVTDGRLNFRGTKKVLTVVASGQTQNMTPDVGFAMLVEGDLVGRSGNDQDGYADWRLSRSP